GYARSRRVKTELREYVLRSLDELRAFADQLVAAAGKRRVDGARDRENVAALFARPSRSDERAGRERSLDDEHAARHAADQSIAPRKIFGSRGRPRNELGDDATRFRDPSREFAVSCRIDAIGTRADERERRSFGRERALVCS